MARVRARRQVVEYQVDAMFLATIHDLVQDVIVQLEAELRARRHALAVHQKLHRRIGHQRHMDSVGGGKRRMRVPMLGDPRTRGQANHHGPQNRASAEVMRADDFIHYRQRRLVQQRPASALNHTDLGPAVTRQKQDGLRLSMHVMLELSLRIGSPSTFIEREYLTSQLDAVDGPQGSDGGVDKHSEYASLACRR